MSISLVIVIVLVAIVFALIMYNISIYKKVDNFNNLNKKIVSLNVLQDFMDTISEDTPATEKLKKVNEILIQKYDIKYSTIVIYDGAEYRIVASNVEQQHWPMLSDLYADPIFSDSIQTATPKYITVDKETERLPYQKNEFGRAKSAMFFPLYIDNVYIGYWIIESGMPHDFDKIDTTVLEVAKNNIVGIWKTVQNQNIVENTIRDDEFSGLKSSQFLFSYGKREADKFPTSTLCMLNITNIKAINGNYGRETGNDLITNVARTIRSTLAQNYIFVRYMGPKFVILFPGVDANAISSYIQTMKKTIEELQVVQNATNVRPGEQPQRVSPTLNIIVTTYYKGTAMEGTTKRMEEYLDKAQENENSINYI